MSQWQPCKRRIFIKKLRKLNFEGPYTGSRHHFMVFQNHRLTIPSNTEYSIPQLKMMLKEVSSIIERYLIADEWNNLT
jgi:hypothetical protein